MQNVRINRLAASTPRRAESLWGWQPPSPIRVLLLSYQADTHGDSSEQELPRRLQKEATSEPMRFTSSVQERSASVYTIHSSPLAKSISRPQSWIVLYAQDVRYLRSRYALAVSGRRSAPANFENSIINLYILCRRHFQCASPYSRSKSNLSHHEYSRCGTRYFELRHPWWASFRHC